MKKYVIMNPLLAGMGGGQMYTRNKVLYMESQGWKVDVIYATCGNIIIKELQKYRNVFPELIFPTCYFSKKKCNSIIKEIAALICDVKYDEIVIESTYFATSLWAEAVSSLVGAKHLIYLIQEDNPVNNSGMQQFFIFKHKRKELVSITDTSLQQMFRSFYPIPKEKSYWLPAYCNNVEADIDSPWIETIDKSRYDYVVGNLGRLEKPYLRYAITDFCNYAKSYRDKKFLLLVIGGTPNFNSVIIDYRRFISENTDNVEVVFTGYLYPIPIRLMDKCDVFFSSAGSSWVCARSGIPTITYDGNDYRPIGVLGRTTYHGLYRDENEPVLDCEQLMNQILIEKKYPKVAASYQDNNPDFSSHVEYLLGLGKEKQYFDVSLIKAESSIEKRIRMGLFMMGASFYYQLYLKKKGGK